MQIQPYLFFEGRCEEAIAFYRSALGAEVMMLVHYKDSPEPDTNHSIDKDKVMHASLRIGETTVLVSDGRCKEAPNFQGFALYLAMADQAEAEKRFTALADGGQVMMPLAKTFWSPLFGMVTDRFGVLWMFDVAVA